jgi:response regulator NasT
MMMYVNYQDPQEVVETAKQLLMQHRRMTEPEAHRYLQMQAMNLRLDKRTVAIQIIHKYKSCVTAS